ncbi:MAG: RnfH family protein [Thiotrichaceae bacterium]
MSSQIQVEVVYGLADEQTLLSFQVDEGITVESAIEQSGVLKEYPDIDLTKNKVGLFGKLTKLTQTLRDKDRIEIYRPLIADPKEVRKKRAAEGKKMAKGGGKTEDSGKANGSGKADGSKDAKAKTQ